MPRQNPTILVLRFRQFSRSSGRMLGAFDGAALLVEPLPHEVQSPSVLMVAVVGSAALRSTGAMAGQPPASFSLSMSLIVWWRIAAMMRASSDCAKRDAIPPHRGSPDTGSAERL